MINYVDVSWSIARKTTCQSCQSESRARQRTPGTNKGCRLAAHPLSWWHLQSPGLRRQCTTCRWIFHYEKIGKETLPEFLEFIGIQLLVQTSNRIFLLDTSPRSTVCFWLQPSQKLSDTGHHPPDSACCSNGCGSGASGRCLKRFAARHRRVIWYCQTWSKSKNLNFLQTCNVFTKSNFKHMLQ